MKRIEIHYGGQSYSVGNRDYEELKAEVVSGLAQGSTWLTVNDGEGSAREAELLLTAGVPIALIPIPDPDLA